MKSPLLFTRLASAIFLLLLISGLSAQTVILSEDFTGFSTGTHSSPSTFDLSSTLDTKTSVPGWTGYKVYSAGGEIKLGTADVPGWIETPEIILTGHEGDLFVKFDIARWPDDAASVKVLLNGSQIGESITPSVEFQSLEIPMPGGVSSCKIRFESLAKRFFLDNVIIATRNTTGMEEFYSMPEVRIFPNPVKGVAVIDNILPYYRMEVYSICGTIIEALDLPGSERITFSMAGYERGLYFIRFHSGSTVFSVRVVKY